MQKEPIYTLLEESIQLAKKGTYKPRQVIEKAKSYLNEKHILSLVGVRRCGKSTIMKELVREALTQTSESNILYLNLEQPFFNQYKQDVHNLQKIFDIFYEKADKRKKLFIFLDEIQFFSDWQIFIKSLYEKNMAKIVLTGSNSKLLSSELSTILSGRTISLHVYPFSLKESKSSLDTYLTQGGFPEVLDSPKLAKELAETYYKNIIYQDVIPRFNVKNSLAMENLSFYLVSNIGKEISYNTLKSISQLDDKTIKEYISYLQDANLLYVLHNYDTSLKKLIGNKKKIYLVDPLFTTLSFKNSPDKGRLFENLVYMELKRLGFDIYFHKNGSECDFILKKGVDIISAIQVCYELHEDNLQREIRGLQSAMDSFNIEEGIVVTVKQSSISLPDTMIELSLVNLLDKFGTNSEN